MLRFIGYAYINFAYTAALGHVVSLYSVHKWPSTYGMQLKDTNRHMHAYTSGASISA